MARKDGKKKSSIIFPILHIIGVVGVVTYVNSSYKVDPPGDRSNVYLPPGCPVTSETANNLISGQQPDLMDSTKLTIVFVILAVMTGLNILVTLGAPAKAGIITLLRVVIEVAILITLYVKMNTQIDNDANWKSTLD